MKDERINMKVITTKIQSKMVSVVIYSVLYQSTKLTNSATNVNEVEEKEYSVT